MRVRLCGSTGVPTWDTNTYPLSCHAAAVSTSRC